MSGFFVLFFLCFFLFLFSAFLNIWMFQEVKSKFVICSFLFRKAVVLQDMLLKYFGWVQCYSWETFTQPRSYKLLSGINEWYALQKRHRKNSYSCDLHSRVKLTFLVLILILFFCYKSVNFFHKHWPIMEHLRKG